jgi:L-rhamnose isomerase/sugar isomerase
MAAISRDELFSLLDTFEIETPSWGYADTGTRFGKFTQPAAASTIEDKLQDAGIVHQYSGCCPVVATHVLWDFTPGVDPNQTSAIAQKNGVRIGSINPNLFQDQVYKFGSALRPTRPRASRRNRTSTVAWKSPAPPAAIACRCGWPTARTTPARTTSSRARSAWKRHSKRGTTPCRPT